VTPRRLVDAGIGLTVGSSRDAQVRHPVPRSPCALQGRG
jgi:hypothetical protein